MQGYFSTCISRLEAPRRRRTDHSSLTSVPLSTSTTLYMHACSRASRVQFLGNNNGSRKNIADAKNRSISIRNLLHYANICMTILGD